MRRVRKPTRSEQLVSAPVGERNYIEGCFVRLNLLLSASSASKNDRFQAAANASGSLVAHDCLHVDAEIAQLAIKMRALHADNLGQLADAAAGLLELAQQVQAFELLACFAQRQAEVDAIVLADGHR